MELQAILFDKFEPACLAIMTTMQKVAFVLLTASLIFSVYQQRSMSMEALLAPLLTVTTLTGFIAFWPELAGSNGFLWKVSSELSRDIEADVWTTYLDTLTQSKESWWDLVSTLRAAITLGIIAMLGMLGEVIMVAARAFQYFFIGLVLAFGPIFLALLAFQTTRSIGVNFLTTTVAIFLWDVAWKLVDLGTINLARATTLFPASTPQALLFIAGWVIVGYIFAPIVVTKAMTAGGNIGGALLAGSVSGGMQLAATSMGLRYALAGMAAQSSIPDKANDAAATGSDLPPNTPLPPGMPESLSGMSTGSYGGEASTPSDSGLPQSLAGASPSDTSFSDSASQDFTGETQSSEAPELPASLAELSGASQPTAPVEGANRPLGGIGSVVAGAGFTASQESDDSVKLTMSHGSISLPGKLSDPGFMDYAQTQADIVNRKKEIHDHVQS